MANIKVTVLSEDKTQKCSIEVDFRTGAVYSAFSYVPVGEEPSKDVKEVK